jgi:DNA polymerase III subunit epsilon
MSFMQTITTTGALPSAVPAGERPLLFLDFEASSLSPESWPIEIGWAWIEDGRVRSGSTLIAPRPEWPLADWSESAARVHGIALVEALAGVDADRVAEHTDAFAGFDVVSDNPSWEQHWLDRLRAGRPRIGVMALRDAIAARLHPLEANWLCCSLLRADPGHRAAADAERLAAAWLDATTRDPMAA